MNEDIKLKPVFLKPFRHFIMTIGELPTAYVDTMTYYEMLLWFVNYLRKTVIPAIDKNALALKEVQDLYVELKKYVDEYFDNLDIQDEIDNKLNEMAQDGTLEEIMSTYLNLKAIFCFDTVADMKQATNLVNGSYAKTLGYYSINDGGSALYFITNQQSTSFYQEELESGLYATLILEEYANAKAYGFKTDGSDNSDKTEVLFKNKKVLFPEGTYVFSNVNINHDIEIIGNNSIIKPTRTNPLNNRFNTLFNFSNNINVKIKDLTFIGYTDVGTQTGVDLNENSLIFADGCKKIEIDNCFYKNFDRSYSLNPNPQMILRRGVLFTIIDTSYSVIKNSNFDNIKGEEMIFCMNNLLDRTDINMDFINNKLTNIYTSGLDFIGNVLNVKNNHYNSTYRGSCLNTFALFLNIENEEIYGSYDSVYDNCEEIYFRGIEVNARNIINHATITNGIFVISAIKTYIYGLYNDGIVENCLRNYFNTVNSDIHKDCTTSILEKSDAYINNSNLLSKHSITTIIPNDSEYNLYIENSELKSTLPSNTYTIYSSPMNLYLNNNIIHNCLTAGSSNPVTLYSRSNTPFKSVHATNNIIKNLNGNAETFITGTMPLFVSFIGNTTNVSNSLIANNLTNVKYFGNYNYNET